MAVREVRAAVVIVVLAALLLGACSDDTTKKGTAARDDVVAVANAVCRQARTTAQADADGYKVRFSGGTPDETAAKDFLVNTVAPHRDANSAGMHDLPIPAKDGRTWSDALAQLDRDLHDFKYGIENDPVGTATKVAAVNPDVASGAGKLFADFGVKDCTVL